jgi:hypothetical protein
MMPQPKKIILWAFTVAGLAFAAQPGQSQDGTQPLIALDSGSIVQLCADCSPRELRLAVTPIKGLHIQKSKTGQENPEVVEVSFGNLRDSSLTQRFVPRWDLDEGGVPRAIIIRVDDKIRKAGNYDLLLSLQPKSMPRAPRLKIQVVHAAAKLELPDKLLVEQTEYWPFSTSTDKMRFDIRESSGASELMDVALQPRVSTLGTDIVTGQLVIDLRGPAQSPGVSPPPFIAAGQTRELTYDLSGNFPLGVVTGSLRFFAPELPDPVTLTFEVHSKLTKIYIVVAIALGLFLSWYLKVYLHNRIELAESRSKAATLLDRVQTDWNSHRDHVFRGALNQPIKALQTAVDGQDAAAITPEITALDGVWRTALQDFATRSQRAQTALDDLRKVTDSAWILPTSVLAILANAKQSPAGGIDIGQAQEEISQNDPSSASDTMAQLRRQLAAELRRRGSEWHQNAVQYVHRLADARAGIPADVVAQFAAAMSKSEPDFKRMKPEQLDADPLTDALIQFLRDFEAEYRAISELLKELSLRLEQEWTEFTKVLNLSPVQVAAVPLFSALKSKLDGFALGLEQATSEPLTALQALQQSLSELQGAWQEVIFQQRDKLPDEARPKVEDLLQGQDFLGAAKLIAAAAAKQKNVILKHGGQPEERATVWPDLAGLSPSSLSLVSSSPQLIGIPSSMAVLHLQSLQQVRYAKAIQTLVVGVLVIIWAYGFYSRTYSGTWSDLSTIFFAAFAIDVTLDAMLSKISPKTA